VSCSSCGADVAAGNRFCGQCGAPVARTCASCGNPTDASNRFCPHCGAPLGEPEPAALAAPLPSPAPVAERRLVSVLFADLVGFTTASEDQDPEAVRDFLTIYFDRAREVIAGHGGTVEKFIGDAVMAVWGAPKAHEDDAERAVRAALELVEAVARLETPQGVSERRLRAGVLTGEAAVTLGAEGQGMVAGDLVNTASRLQSAAPAGAVLVGESTYHATSGSIAFEAAGEQTLKGKALPVPAWRALRVVAQRGGTGRSERLEAPFVGRDEELRLVKDLFHATAREGRARLLSVVGQAGIGKSRLIWELTKYIDGLIEDVRWHEGRSPAYGEGITYWALGEMVRERAGIAETDDEETTRSRLTAALVQYVPDAEERRWIEPRLAALLGLEETPAGEREELYAAWRTFFERVSETGTTVLVFDDLQWADNGLIDFIEHLMEWSRARPIFIMTLARPDLLDRRPNWGAGQHSFTSLHLDPLADSEVGGMLTGLAPGLPQSSVQAVLARAEGVPLYAVESIRMLVDQGKLVPEDGAYRLVGEIESLAVPETLQALIAARLDGLDPADRSLLQNASVLGHSFTLKALAFLTGDEEESLESRLRALVRREFLRQEDDPRSPERGQFQFVQELIKEVAYGTLAKADRRSRHLAAARYFEELGDEELAGLLAVHYLRAYEATPAGPEADALAAQARVALRGAGERAAALHSHEQALAYFEQALTVTTDPSARVDLGERAALSAISASRYEIAETYLDEAIKWHEANGDRPATARATARLASVLSLTGRVQPAAARLEAAVRDFADIPSAPEVIELNAELARAYMFREDWLRTVETADEALRRAEQIDHVPVIAEALVTKGSAFGYGGRGRESAAILRGALALAEANGLSSTELRALNNLSFIETAQDPRSGLSYARQGLERSRKLGNLSQSYFLLSNMTECALHTGDWDLALAERSERERPDLLPSDRLLLVGPAEAIMAMRGDTDGAETSLRVSESALAQSSDPQAAAIFRLGEARIALVAGRLDEAYEKAIEAAGQASAVFPEISLPVAGRAALWLSDRSRLRAVLERMEELGGRPGWVAANIATLKAGLAALESRYDEAAPIYRDAAQRWRDLELWPHLGLSQMEFATLVPDDADAATAAQEARDIFTRLNSPPLLKLLEEGPLRKAVPGVPERVS
jgi:class 3 adenylate cyclase/tetratricopeptide (TPR) repeat protein